MEPSPDSLLCWQSGKYDCKSTGVRDSLSLNCDEGVAVGHQPPQHTLFKPFERQAAASFSDTGDPSAIEVGKHESTAELLVREVSG